MTEANIYQIRIRNVLDESWSDWFEGLSVHVLPDRTTLLRGPLADQSALFGILGKIHDLNLQLISVQEVTATPEISRTTHSQDNTGPSGETIYETYSMLQAVTIQTLLGSAGIQTSLVKQQGSRPESGESDALVKIVVPEKQLYQAEQLLAAVPRRGEIFCVPEDVEFDRE